MTGSSGKSPRPESSRRTEAANSTRPERQAPAEPRRGLQELLERTREVLAKDLFMGGAFVVVLSLLLIPGDRTPPHIPAVGEVSPREVLAPIDVQIPDEAAIAREQERRVAAVPVTLDYDPSHLESSLARLAQLCEAGREAAKEAGILDVSRSDDVVSGGPSSSPVDLVLLSLLRKTGPLTDVPIEVVAALARTGFDAAHQESLQRVLRTTLSKRISDLDRNGIDALRGKEIVARDVKSGAEAKLWSIEDLFTLDQARRFVATELAQEADLWERAVRPDVEAYLSSLVTPNVSVNPARREERIRAVLATVPTFTTEVKKGEKIVGRGERVTPEIAQKQAAIEDRLRKQRRLAPGAGIVIILALFAFALKRYVDYHQASEKRVPNLYALVVLCFLASALCVSATIGLAASIAERFQGPPWDVLEPYLYVAPYALGSLLLTLLVDSEIAMVFAVSFSLVAGLLASATGEFTIALYALLSGFGAIYFTGPYLRRTALFTSGLAIGACCAVAVLGVGLLKGTWQDPPLLGLSLAMAVGSGIAAAAVAQLLLPILESLFGILTDLKLSELMSANHPLIKELALRAPGTYNHSIIVGTLAEAAAKAIGVNPVFMRAAAYYHDIGKMKMPEYFIENQVGAVNRHDKLSPSLSALIVKSHVKDGIEMGRAHGLPEALIEMIPAHHGTRLLAYFYRKAKELEDSDRSPVKEGDYRYPGPRPRNKEGAIMMLCDAVEAAARSLSDPTTQKFRNVIDKMTETIYLDGQLDDTDLTLKDLHAIREAFHKVLLSIYHHRIRYPGFDFEKREKKPSRTPRTVEDGEDRPRADVHR